MAAGSGVSLRLGQLFDMDEGWHMGLARDFSSFSVCRNESRIIPPVHNIDVISVTADTLWTLEAAYQLGDIFLGNLALICYGDTITVIVDSDDRR